MFHRRPSDPPSFPVWAVQCDGGHEFRGAFEQAALAAGIRQFVNRPNYPQGNGRVERSFLTNDQEFHEVEESSLSPHHLRVTLRSTEPGTASRGPTPQMGRFEA